MHLPTTTSELALKSIQQALNLPDSTSPTEIAAQAIGVIELAKAQELRYRLAETSEKYADAAIDPVEEVVRDDRGLWRHPLLPLFLSSEARSAWVKAHNLDAVGTYLTEPEPVTDEIIGWRDWEVNPPAQPGYFLLAIEPTSNGPVAIWGRKLS